MSANGTSELTQIMVPTASLRPNTWNPNVQSDVVKRAERESITTYGFIDPVTVRPHPDGNGYEIIDGEHRWEMAQELGIPDIPVIPLELDDADARKLTVVLNETRGDADVVLLSQLLADIRSMTDEQAFANALPYTPAELEQFLNLGGDDWDAFQQVAGDPVLPASNTRELTLVFADSRVFDRFTKHLAILAKEWDMADAGATEVVTEAVKRAALEANQGRKAAKT